MRRLRDVAQGASWPALPRFPARARHEPGTSPHRRIHTGGINAAVNAEKHTAPSSGCIRERPGGRKNAASRPPSAGVCQPRVPRLFFPLSNAAASPPSAAAAAVVADLTYTGFAVRCRSLPIGTGDTGHTQVTDTRQKLTNGLLLPPIH